MKLKIIKKIEKNVFYKYTIEKHWHSCVKNEFNYQ